MKILQRIFFFCVVSFFPYSMAHAQEYYWQQQVAYEMDIDMNVNTHRFEGRQKLTYSNNSPDTLDKVFYHLYFNAFQPGSMMDVRSRTIDDADPRVRDRILHLSPEEIGYLKVQSLNREGKSLTYTIDGTVMEVPLAKPILPGEKTTFEMQFTGQVPLQIRRSGRDNAEGIAYSMSQWYPKLAEYDVEGWHANPYVGREFYGVWGSYEVSITIDSAYVVAATGYLQNPQEVGHGYEKSGQTVNRPKGNTITYHFQADQVHDFVWAADPDYTHTIAQVPNGPAVHFFYQTDTAAEHWQRLPEFTVEAFQYMNQHFGRYPYEKYSVIQGGDGGMEYPMATLITGHRSLGSLVGVTVHEMVHSWYQGVLATNESLYPWMDEGFTSYASNRIMAHIMGNGSNVDPQANSYAGYFSLVESGLEEPLSTHADHYNTNRAYGLAAYAKGAVFLHQLSYVIGQETLDRGMRRYFNTWKFKHPTASSFKRIMEKESGIELDWYFEYFMNTTHTIDYGIKSVEDKGEATHVTLERGKLMPMPLDVVVTYQDGRREMFYIPLHIMWGKKKEERAMPTTTLSDWPWVYPTYLMVIPQPVGDIKQIEIDPSGRMADITRDNNVYPALENTRFEGSTNSQ